MNKSLQEAIHLLESTGYYQVLKKISADRLFEPSAIDESIKSALGDIRTAIVLDTETTGTTSDDEIIQLSMIKFAYDTKSGRVLKVIGRYNAYNEPSKPITEEITAITHITNDMVKGCAIDELDVNVFLMGADLIVAHNAKFDRGMLENNILPRIPGYAPQAWACSQLEIDWKAYGASNAKLEFLLFKAGYAYSAHRADIDCEALLYLLDTPMKIENGEPHRPMQQLHASAIQKSYKVWAIGAPFDAKDLLKARGYAWSDGTTDHKAWYIVTNEEGLQAEKDFLEASIFKRKMNLTIEHFDAKTRYTETAKKTNPSPVRPR